MVEINRPKIQDGDQVIYIQIKLKAPDLVRSQKRGNYEFVRYLDG